MIEALPGENFTEKFVSTVRVLVIQRVELEADLKRLERERQRKFTELSDLDALVRKANTIRQNLDRIQFDIISCQRDAKTLREGLEQVKASSDQIPPQ